MALESSKSIVEAVVKMLSTVTYPAGPKSTEFKNVMLALETGDEVGSAITKQNQATAREESDVTRPPFPRIGIRVADVEDTENKESYGHNLVDSGLFTLRELRPLPMVCVFTVKVYSKTNYQLFPIWASLQFKMHPVIPIEVRDDESGSIMYLRKTDVRQRTKTAPFGSDSPQAILDFSVPFWQLTTEAPERVIRHETFSLLDGTVIVIGENND